MILFSFIQKLLLNIYLLHLGEYGQKNADLLISSKVV